MIQYLENNAIDYDKWDRCIATASNRLIYGFAWYLDIVCDDWDALVLNDYEAVMPLPKRKKWGIQYVYQPFFCQQLGVFSQLNNETLVSDFLVAIPSHFRYIEMNLNTANGIPPSCCQENVNYELGLSVDYNTLLKNFSKSNLKNIQKSTVLDFIYSEDLIAFMSAKRILAANHMNEEQLQLLSSSLISLQEIKKVMICQAKNNSEVVAEVVMVLDEKRIVLLTSYSSSEGRRFSAIFGLLDYIFQQNQGQDIVFDFEGSNLLGVAKRNKGFGAQKSVYASIKMNRLPFLLRWLK